MNTHVEIHGERIMEDNELFLINYKKNFLSEVVIRVDFLNTLPELEKNLPIQIRQAATRNFPIVEPPKTSVSKEYKLTPEEIKETDRKEKIEWNFFKDDRKKRLFISSKEVFSSYLEYSSFEDLKFPFLYVLRELNNCVRDLQCRRLGLRFINNISFQSGDPFDWKKLINHQLIQTINFPSEKRNISRAFNVLDFNFDDYMMRFQFGLFNPDFPARIKQKQFILDIDAYSERIQDYNEILISIEKFHNKIQQTFESCIQDDLREIMNVNG